MVIQVELLVAILTFFTTILAALLVYVHKLSVQMAVLQARNDSLIAFIHEKFEDFDKKIEQNDRRPTKK